MGNDEALGQFEQHRDLLKEEIRTLGRELSEVKPKYLRVMSIVKLREEQRELQRGMAIFRRKLSSLRFKYEKAQRWKESNDVFEDIQEARWEKSTQSMAQLNERLESEVQDLKEQLYDAI